MRGAAGSAPCDAASACGPRVGGCAACMFYHHLMGRRCVCAPRTYPTNRATLAGRSRPRCNHNTYKAGPTRKIWTLFAKRSSRFRLDNASAHFHNRMMALLARTSARSVVWLLVLTAALPATATESSSAAGLFEGLKPVCPAPGLSLRTDVADWYRDALDRKSVV